MTAELHRPSGYHGACLPCCIYTKREDEISLFVKFSKTTLCVQVVPAVTSVGALIQQIREALIASNQPLDDVLARPFSETQPGDFELYEKIDQTFVTLSSRADASARAEDGTPLCSACGLQDGSVLYVGFRVDSQGMYLILTQMRRDCLLCKSRR